MTVRRILRYGILGSVILLLILAGVMAFFSLPPGERIVRGILETQLASLLNQPVRIADFETNVLSRVRVSGVELLNTSNKSRVIAINNILLNYSLVPLVSREIRLVSLHVDSVFVVIRRDTAGSSGVTMLDETQEAGKTYDDTSRSFFRVVIDTIQLSSLSVEYADESRQVFAEVKNMSFSLVRDDENSHIFTATNRAGIVRYGAGDPADFLINFAGHVSPKRVSVDSLKGEIGGMTLRGTAVVPEEETEPLHADISVTGTPNTLLNAFGNRDVSVEGGIHLHLTAKGTRKNPVTKVRAEIARAKVKNVSIESGRLALQATRNEISVDTLAISAYRGSLQAGGVFTVADTSLRNGELTLRNIDLAALVKDLTGAVPATTGFLSGRVLVEGTGMRASGWNATADAAFSGVKLKGEDLPGATMTGWLRGGLFNAVFEQDNNTLSVRGGISDKAVRGEMRADIPRVAAFARLAGFDGARGDFHAKGTFNLTEGTSDVRVKANGTGLSYKNVPLDTIITELHYRDRKLRITSLEFSGALNPIPEDSAPFDLRGLSGSVEYAGELSGTLNNLTGSISAALTDLEYEGQKLDSAGIRFDLDGSLVEVTHGRIVRDSLELVLGGKFDTRKTEGELVIQASVAHDSTELPLRKDAGRIVASFRAGGNSLNLTSSGRHIVLSVFAPFVPDSLRVGGKADFDLSLSGAIRNPEVRLTARIVDPYVDTIRLDSILAGVSLSNHLVEVDHFSIHRRDHKAAASGTILLTQDSTGAYTVTPRSSISGELTVSTFDLQTFEPLMPEGGSLSGRTSLDLAWSGTVTKPGVTGMALLDSLRISYTPEVEPVELSMRAALSDTVITIDYANGKALGQPFVIKGYVTRQGLENLRTDLVMDFSESGKFVGKGVIGRENIDFVAEVDRLDVALFRPFATRVKDLKGTIDSRMTLSGNTMMPEMQGYLTVRDVSMRPEALDQTVSNGILKASFRGNSITIDSLFARIGDGTFLVTGGFAVAQEAVRDVRLAARAGRIKLTSPEEFVVTVDTATLQYAPRNEYYMLTGDIKFGDSRLTKDLEPDAILPWARSVERPETELPALLQQTRMDIRVRESENLWVDNNLARMRMHAELSITGNPARPNLSGRLSITNGYLLYLDRKFDVKEGEFLFSDPNRLNPDIRLKAQSQVTTYQGMSPQTYTVQFSAEGPMEQLVVNLTSEPPLDKPDIVALLTVGATRSQLTAGDGTTRNVLIDRVQMIASGRISNMLTQRAGSLLGLDEMSVQGNLFSFNGDAGPKLVLGKQITDRARVTYSTTVGRSNEQSFRVDYQLTKRFSLLGETTQAGRSSLSLKYGFLFK